MAAMKRAFNRTGDERNDASTSPASFVLHERVEVRKRNTNTHLKTNRERDASYEKVARRALFRTREAV